MARRKTEPEQTDLLAPVGTPDHGTTDPGTTGPQTTDPGTPPRLLDFTPRTSGVRWRVERFDELAAQFQFACPPGGSAAAWAERMSWFHEFAQRHTRAWLVVRRVFGVAPMIPPPETRPDDLRAWTRAEVEAEGFNVAGELEALGGLWRSSLEQEQRTEPGEPEPQTSNAEQAKGELALDDRLLERHGFSERMFDMQVYDPVKKSEVPRSDEERRRERDWFCGQVRHWEKMLSDPQGGPKARAALRSMLYLERIANEMSVCSPTTGKYRDLNELHRKTQADYQKQLDELQVMFPEMTVAGKVSFRAVVSDLNAAHRAYYGHKDRRLMDKVFTATEVEFLLRTSVQLPVPRYRLGLNLAIIEAQHGLYDPEFRSQLKPQVLKKLTAGFVEAVALAREADEHVVDLEKGVLPGEGDDFEDYKAQ